MTPSHSQTPAAGLSSFFLRNLAMLLMTIDHIGLVLFPKVLELRYIGRLAFPIFAFLIVEGFFHTRSLKNYLIRLLGLALITDLPFQFMGQGNFDYVPFRNVIWTFLIGLAAISAIEEIRKRSPLPLTLAAGLAITALACWLAILADCDYDYLGVLTIIGLYVCHGRDPRSKLGQLIVLILVNVLLAGIKWFDQLPFITLDNFGTYWRIYGIGVLPTQIWAVWAMLPLWFYNGKPGYKSPATQALAYLFYPLHMLIIGWLGLMF